VKYGPTFSNVNVLVAACATNRRLSVTNCRYDPLKVALTPPMLTPRVETKP
jgi:hypothetical protein